MQYAAVRGMAGKPAIPLPSANLKCRRRCQAFATCKLQEFLLEAHLSSTMLQCPAAGSEVSRQALHLMASDTHGFPGLVLETCHQVLCQLDYTHILRQCMAHIRCNLEATAPGSKLPDTSAS